jgi:hypothetical protein
MERGFIDGEYQDGEVRGLTFVAGERGMGKTTEVVRLTRQCTGAVVFFDTVNRHRKLLPGFVVINEPGKLKQYLIANKGRRVRVCYVPLNDFPEVHIIGVCTILRALGEWLGGVIFMVDEIDEFCAAKWGEHRMPLPLYRIAHYGRHYWVSMAVTARDPASLSIRFRSQCAYMRLFRTSESRYVDYFAAKIGKENAAKLRTLQKTYYLYWEAGNIDAEIRGGPRKLVY